MTLEDYCRIGIIPKKLKEEMRFFIGEGHRIRVSVMHVLNSYTDTNEIVHRIQEYEKALRNEKNINRS